MTRGEELAAELEQVTADVADFVAACSDEQWAAVVPGEGWTVAAVVNHIALGNDQATTWLGDMVAGRGVSTTSEDLDRANAEHAAAHETVAKAEVLATLFATSDRAVALLRSLSDEDLAVEAPFAVAGPGDFPAAAFAEAVPRHPRGHLGHARAAAGVG